jgi:hypothetical protein
MPATLLFDALLLFALMLLPLPAPLGLAVALWALGAGLPLPAVLIIYIVQDVLTYTAIRRLLASPQQPLARLNHQLPRPMQRIVSANVRPMSGEGGLCTATLLSFYAGAALAAVRRTAVLRSAALVVGVDVLKYANGLAVALGAAHVLPTTPLTMLFAPLAGVGAMLLCGLIRRERRVAVPVRIT